jgi:hypothetical protein
VGDFCQAAHTGINELLFYRYRKKPGIQFVLMLLAVVVLVLPGCSKNWDSLGAQEDVETLQPFWKVFDKAYYYVYGEETGIYTLYDVNKKRIGYAFYTTAYGYIGEINILVGLENKKTIKGISVMSQNETPSYWYYLVSSNFFSQFRDLAIDRCYVHTISGDGGKVDGVTRATISANAITIAVKESAVERAKLIK